MKKICILLVACLFVVHGSSFAQQGPTKEELQKKEADTRKEIAELTALLTQKQKDKKLSVKEAAAVQRKIDARMELINNINRQVKVLDETIYRNELDIYRMKKELDTLKQKYAQSIVFAYKNRSSYQYLNFLFSATSFNDALKRMTYLKSYRQLRETQVDNILKTQAVLQEKMGTLTSSRQEQAKALQNQKGELVELEEDKKEKDKVVKELRSQEKEITAQIRKKEKQRQDMKNAFAAIIRRERIEEEKREKLARQKAIEDEKKRLAAEAAAAKNSKATGGTTSGAATTKPGAGSTTASTNKPDTKPEEVVPSKPTPRPMTNFSSVDENAAITMSFEKNRGNLPWPVSTGSVVIGFGNYSAGGKIVGNSDGIEIELPEGSSVKCVADGKVSFVGDVGEQQVVIVKHGKYYTSYSHLSSINVGMNQEVKAGTLIGKAGTDFDGRGSLLFMVTDANGKPLNPKYWLRPSR